MPDPTIETFGTLHIALTALITSALVLALAAWTFRGKSWLDAAAMSVLAGLTVFLWRESANMPQLNGDGLSWFSANDWLAPVVTYVVLGCYGAFSQRTEARQLGKARALAIVATLLVNVVTI